MPLLTATSHSMLVVEIFEGQKAMNEEAEEEVGRRSAFVESLVNSRKSRESPSLPASRVADTVVEETDSQPAANTPVKTQRNDSKCTTVNLLAI